MPMQSAGVPMGFTVVHLSLTGSYLQGTSTTYVGHSQMATQFRAKCLSLASLCMLRHCSHCAPSSCQPEVLQAMTEVQRHTFPPDHTV